jgi:hypothetical protein
MSRFLRRTPRRVKRELDAATGAQLHLQMRMGQLL